LHGFIIARYSLSPGIAIVKNYPSHGIIIAQYSASQGIAIVQHYPSHGIITARHHLSRGIIINKQQGSLHWNQSLISYLIFKPTPHAGPPLSHSSWPHTPQRRPRKRQPSLRSLVAK
jgi:hypothetical protein